MKKWGAMILHKFCYFCNLHTHQSDFFNVPISLTTLILSQKKLRGTKITISLYAFLPVQDISSGCTSQQQASSQKAHWHITINHFGLRGHKCAGHKQSMPILPLLVATLKLAWVCVIYQSKIPNIWQQNCVLCLQGMIPRIRLEAESLGFSI